MTGNISEECKTSIKQHGILWNDGKPAAQDLINKDVLKVAIVQGGDVMKEIMTDDMRAYLADKAKESNAAFEIKEGAALPAGSENSIRRAIGYWHVGEIKIVGAKDSPDIRVAAVNAKGQGYAGYATFPINDSPDPRDTGFDKPTIFVNMAGVRREVESGSEPSIAASVENVVRHEAGHNFGILHPNLNSSDGNKSGLPVDVCTREDSREIAFGGLNKNVMEDRVEGAPAKDGDIAPYDQMMRDTVSSGQTSSPPAFKR